MNRNEVFDRDENRCVYCGEQFESDELTLDHVQPRVRGGDHSKGNLVAACKACNTLKGHQRLSEFLFAHPPARENFFRYAAHVWPRLMRIVQSELDALDRRRTR